MLNRGWLCKVMKSQQSDFTGRWFWGSLGPTLGVSVMYPWDNLSVTSNEVVIVSTSCAVIDSQIWKRTSRENRSNRLDLRLFSSASAQKIPGWNGEKWSGKVEKKWTKDKKKWQKKRKRREKVKKVTKKEKKSYKQFRFQILNLFRFINT